MATEKTYDFDEAFFTSVFNQLTTNIFIKDAETDVIVYMNDAMKREFGQIHRKESGAGRFYKGG